MKVVAIAIVARNRVIGDGSGQPFKYAEDWRHFKQATLGHPMIMGRRTFELTGCLPGRTSIVITRTPEAFTFPTGDAGRPSGYSVSSLEQALTLAETLDEVVYVIGGGEIYRLAWQHLDELDLTEVHADGEGTVDFPIIDPAEWVEAERDCRGEFDFVRYLRR